MARIGIFFGTETGRTRLIAKQIAKKLGDEAAAPLNVAKAAPEDLLAYEVLILGTPTLGDGELPGLATGLPQESWAEFVKKIQSLDLGGKIVALYGLGEQEKYGEHFVSALKPLHDAFRDAGATLVGHWPVDGYAFSSSAAVEDGHFLGLALDQISQPALTAERVDSWLEQIKPSFPA
ncbi:MAG: flavodoxin [Rhodocyclaceae bacterium]|nr:flavodoxin [Rhodocyclaceae bacterium]